jgi:hypothetical protein
MHVAAQPTPGQRPALPLLWKQLRAQWFDGDQGQLVPPGLRLELTQARRARLRFTLDSGDRHAVEAAGFTVVARSDGLNILAKGSLIFSSPRQGMARQGDAFELLLRDASVYYRNSGNTSELIRRDGPWPSFSAPAGERGRAVLGTTVEPVLRLDSSDAKRARIRFTLRPDDSTTVECEAFTVTTSRDGLKVVTAGRAVVSSAKGLMEAGGLELWLSHGGGAGYRAIGASTTR